MVVEMRKAGEGNLLEKTYVLDTNVILRMNVDEIVERFTVAIPSMVLRELEKFELNPDKYGKLAYNAREKRRRLRNLNKVYIDLKDYEWRQDDGLSKSYTDNNILQYCLDTNSGLITFDGLLREKAIEYGIEVINVEEEFEVEDDYTGYTEVFMSPEEHQDFYTNRLDLNEFDLYINEYLIIKDDVTGEEIDAFRWDGEYYTQIKPRSISSFRMGKFTPRDLYQACAVDSVMNNTLTLLNGKAGTAKTLISLTYAMQQLESGDINKIVVFANPMPTRNAAQLGLYKGSLRDKLMQTSIGHILASKLGDRHEVEAMMDREELVVLPFSDIRGFDTTDMNCMVFITEAQNLDRPLMQLALERLGMNQQMVIEGDNNQQLDHFLFEGKNNGMFGVSEVFRGMDYYGQMQLKYIYRSPIAERAQLLTKKEYE